VSSALRSMIRRHKKTESVSSPNFPVLIGVPVPMIDSKNNHRLTGFIAGCAARKIAIPDLPTSRTTEFSRNMIINDFLTRPEYKSMRYLMFIDADTCPIDDYAIERMMMLDKDVVSGVTPIMFGDKDNKQMFWNVVVGTCGNMPLNELPEKPFRANRVGGSCLLIKREVLEKLKKPYQKPTYDEDYVQFKQSEDYYFCQNILDAGYDIWVDPTVMCHHFHIEDYFDWIEFVTKLLNGQQQRPLGENEVIMLDGRKLI
jgi:hypothetical protein